MSAQNHEAIRQSLSIEGYAVLTGTFDSGDTEECVRRLEQVHTVQQHEFGAERLWSIGELSLVRSPLSYDPFFLDIALKPSIIEAVCASIAGGFAVLHSQNAFTSSPSDTPRKSTWHRSDPLQDLKTVTSHPMAISCTAYLDDAMGDDCMHVLPSSHRYEDLPSKSLAAQNENLIRAVRGSVVVADAMLIRRWGHRKHPGALRIIEHVYTVPQIKPEIDLSGVPHVQKRARADAWARAILAITQSS